MDLPTINPSRLQKVVFDIECRKSNLNFEDLTFAVAQSNWACEEELDAEVIGKLMIAHKTITKTKKPVPQAEETPAPKALPVAPASVSPETVPEPPSDLGCRPSLSNDGAPEPRIIKTFDVGGKGRKQCPKCTKYVGAVTKVCACGHEFRPAAKAAPAPVSTPAPAVNVSDDSPSERKATPLSAAAKLIGAKRSIVTPSGSCPHRLDSPDLTSVTEWSRKVRNTYGENYEFMTLTALIYFVRHFFPIGSKDHTTAKQHLEELYGHEQNFAA